MTQEEYNSTDWQRGNVVRLTNGKEYPVKRPKKRFLLLYSAEYEAYFVADCNIIECRTSDNVEPYPEKKSANKADQESAPVAETTPASAPASAPVSEPAPATVTTPSAEATPAPEAKPKRKRQRITIKGTSVEKIVL